MNKHLLALCLFLVLFVLVECSGKCRPVCKPKVSSRVICAASKGGRQCRRIKECRLKEENCRLRSIRRPVWIQTSSQLCRNIKSSSGIGKCARPIKKGVKSVRQCTPKPCNPKDLKLRCNRDSTGKCQLLTPCQRVRENCRRGPRNELNQTDRAACAGMSHGQKPKQCRPIKKRG